jgi:hypothetical protein
MLPLWFAFLGGSFVFLNMNFVHCFPHFWVLWFIYDLQGFAIITLTPMLDGSLRPKVQGPMK